MGTGSGRSRRRRHVQVDVAQDGHIELDDHAQVGRTGRCPSDAAHSGNRRADYQRLPSAVVKRGIAEYRPFGALRDQAQRGLVQYVAWMTAPTGTNQGDAGNLRLKGRLLLTRHRVAADKGHEFVGHLQFSLFRERTADASTIRQEIAVTEHEGWCNRRYLT